MKYKGVIFDLDGTLIDTAWDIGYYINMILARHSFPEIDLANVSSIVGWGLRDAMEKALAGAVKEGEKIDLFTKELISEYSKKPVIRTYKYKGTDEMLDYVRGKGLKTALYSNKAHPVTEKIVHEMFGSSFFDIARGAVEGFPKKPDPAGALLIAEQLGIDPDEMLYLGDSDVDCVTAKRGGFRFIAALWGYRSRKELEAAGASDFVESPGRFSDFLT